ncbi:MAG: hypothetical protein VX240_07250 [Actinomycetota bacterium]|nr:hypothetical protein [Actinomycetota bacterium]
MNHTRIAAEVLRFRLDTLSGHTDVPFDLHEAAEVVVACGDPGVDRALRVVGETWRTAGLAPAAIDHPWSAGEIDRMRNVGGATLLDAVDELVAGLARCRSRA